ITLPTVPGKDGDDVAIRTYCVEDFGIGFDRGNALIVRGQPFLDRFVPRFCQDRERRRAAGAAIVANIRGHHVLLSGCRGGDQASVLVLTAIALSREMTVASAASPSQGASEGEPIAARSVSCLASFA